MRSAWFFAVALALSCKSRAGTPGAGAASTDLSDAAAAADGGVALGKRPLTAGEVRTVVDTRATHMRVVVAGRTTELDEVDTKKTTEEVLAASGGAVTKLRVTYLVDEKASKANGGPEAKRASPVTGKSYVLSSEGGTSLSVLGADGRPAEPAELAVVLHDHAELGKPDPLVSAAPVRPLSPGDEVVELAEGLRAALRTDEKMTVDAVKVKLARADPSRGVAVFDVEATLRGDAGLFRVRMPLRGELSLRLADARPTSLVLDGPVVFDAAGLDGGATNKTVDGTVRMTLTTTYP